MTDINQILELVASSESTEKLQKYWLGQFQAIVNNELIELDSSLIDALNSSIDNPETPRDKAIAPVAMLNILKHIDAQNEIDEINLQSTVETMLRLLDDAIDAINLTPDARKVIETYRRVAMGVYNFDKYIELKKIKATEEEIDKVASAFSNAAYRSSEALAEEKGVCAVWNDMKLKIKPRMFEYWYNTENGEIYNGYEVSQMYTQEAIIGSNMEIIPRRNATLLAFGMELGWRDWSDRESVPVVKINNDIDEDNQNMFDNNLTKNTLPVTPSFVPELDPELNIKPEVKIESIPLENVLPEIMNSFPTKSFFNPSKTQEVELTKFENEENDKPEVVKPPLSKTILDKTAPIFESSLLLDNLDMNFQDDNIVTTLESPFSSTASESLLKFNSSNTESKETNKKDEPKSQKSFKNESLVENTKDVFNILNPFSKKPVTNNNPIFTSNDKTTNITLEESKSNTNKSNPKSTKLSTTNSMSKFTIALQQIINSPEFNQILINAQYDANGLKMISVSGEKLNGELSSLVRTYIGLVNMSLAKGITASDIAEELTEDLDASSQAATRVLSLIANALKEFPNRITEVKPETIATLDLKTVREATKTKRNVLEILG